MTEQFNQTLANAQRESTLSVAEIPAIEHRTYADELTSIEKAEADEMATDRIAKNGDMVSTEILRVMKFLNDPKTDMPRAERRVLRAYIDSLAKKKAEQ